MNPYNVTAQTVTNASGTVAIASSSTSFAVSNVTAGVTHDPVLLENVHSFLSWSEAIGLVSVVTMILSFAYTVYSSQRKRMLDLQSHELRAKEYSLDLAKFRVESLNKMGANQDDV